MKRFIAAVGSLLLIAAFFVPALAENTRIAAHLVVRPVKFRTVRAPGTAGYNLSDGANSAAAESSAYTAQLAGTNALDTTSAIPLMDLPLPAELTSSYGATAAADTMTFAGRLVLSDAGSTGTVDTMYAWCEVSVDQKNWVRVATQDTTGTVPVPTTTFPHAMVVQAQGRAWASKVFSWPIPYGLRTPALLGAAIASNTVADFQNLRFWPYIRFVVAQDGSSATAIKNFNAYWVTYGTSVEPNQ